MPEFTLRPMEPTDGPAIAALIREEAQTTSISMTTSYRHDVYQSLMAQHPSLFGVVAETPGVDGLAGFATAFLDEVTIGWPAVSDRASREPQGPRATCVGKAWALVWPRGGSRKPNGGSVGRGF